MTTYLHYIRDGAEPPPLGMHRFDYPSNVMWQRKQAPWQVSGMYPLREVDLAMIRQHGYNRTEYEAHVSPLRQAFNVQLENVVEANRPQHLPSRMRCMYLWDDRADFKADAQRMGVDLSTRVLVRVKPVPGESRLHRARLDALDVPRNSSEHRMRKAAKRYWKEVPEPTSGTEVLLVGAYEVVAL